MRVPLEWISDFVDHGLTTDELASRLTMIGLNVESIHRPAVSWHDVYIGQVVALSPHPSSRNPLNIAEVDLGTRQVTIVTGAPNVRLNDKVPTVLVGGMVPHGPDGHPMMIESKPMAGITSQGMLCSARELGISDEHSGIYLLPPDAPVGALLSSVMGGDVLDIETVSNRPDTMSIVGVAREVAAATQSQLLDPHVTGDIDGVEWLPDPSIALQVDVPELCPRFSIVRVDGVRAAPSPSWLVSRLTAAGQRPINLLVDLTNYVMLETGQPMHAFDAARLTGEGIVVRLAQESERIRTLDGVDRVLPPGTVVVADGQRAASVAGIIGGEGSEIRDDTTTILLEAASWNPPNIRASARALGLRTEASSRFERGQPPEATVPAILRYLQLLAQESLGTLRVWDVSDSYPTPPAERTVTMPMRDLNRLVGIRIDIETVAEHMSLLGFGVEVDDDALTVKVPSWRRIDIEQSADIVEEVARSVGFDELPATLPRRTMKPPVPHGGAAWKAIIRERLLSMGLNEVTTHSLTSPAMQARLFPGASSYLSENDEVWSQAIPNADGVAQNNAHLAFVRLQNPASADRQVLRLSLLPSVLDVVSRNAKETDERLAFFELDRTFFHRTVDLPYERETLAVALCGLRTPRGWAASQPGPFTFYDIKGILEEVAHRLQIESWQVEPCVRPCLHPGRAASLMVEGTEVAYFGELHPDTAATFELEGQRVQVAEVDLDALAQYAHDNRIFQALPRFPAAYRDIAAVVDRDLPVARVLEVIRDAAGDLLERARVFDVYQGAQLADDKKSIAVEMAFRSHDGTLTQDEVSAVMDRMTESIRTRLSATLRD